MNSFDKDASKSPKFYKIRRALFRIVKRNKHVKLQRLLNYFSVDEISCNEDGWYLLHEALYCSSTMCAWLLIEWANKNNVDILKWDQLLTFHPKLVNPFSFKHVFDPVPQNSFLYLAVMFCESLVDDFVKLYQSQAGNDYGICEAIAKCVLHPSKLLLLLKAFPAHVDKTFKTLQLPLFVAVGKNALESVMIILKFKPNLQNFERTYHGYMSIAQYATIMACEFNNIEILKVLLDAGVDINNFASFHSSNIDESLLFKTSPIELAILNSSLTVVECLLNNGVDLYVKISFLLNKRYHHMTQPMHSIGYHASAIFIAAFKKKYEILQYLVSIVDKAKLGKLGLTSPVIGAVISCSPQSLRILLNSGFSIDGSLPNYENCELNHPWGRTMLDNVNIYVDDMSYATRPALTVLRILMNMGVKLSENIDCLQLLVYLIFYPEPISLDSLLLFIKYGILEFVFKYSTAKFTNFLHDNISIIKKLYYEEIDVSITSLVWLDKEKISFYLERLNNIIQHTGRYSLIDDNFDLNPIVPNLQKLCRYAIRCCVMNSTKTVLPLKKLPLPPKLIKYLH